MITVLARRALLGLLPFSTKSLLFVLALIPSVFIWLYLLGPALSSGMSQTTSSPATSSNPATLHIEEEIQPIDLAARPYSSQSNISVNLVVATTRMEDIAWTSQLRIPNLRVIRYVSDDPLAPYHPPVAKGREALMYHTYLYEFYDDLPDISILIHADEKPWHADPELWSSMLFTLSNLNLDLVMGRGYANLRVGWYQACPDWINTTKSVGESTKKEEPWMATAFRANFGDDVEVPEIMAGPCCSQFAVTREAVRRRGREEYARAMNWLIETDWSDYIVGRVWERMWSWLFMEQATDCPIEWKVFCRMYGVCFEDADQVSGFRALWDERKSLVEGKSFWREWWDPKRARSERVRIEELNRELDGRLKIAMDRGEVERASGQKEVGDLYIADTPTLHSRANKRP